MVAHSRLLVTIPICLVLLLAGGCDSTPAIDAESLAVREKLLTAKPIGAATTIADARLSALESRSADRMPEVIIAGNIDANGHDPWEKDQSSFVIMDASEDYLKIKAAHNHEDDDDCPFCKRKSDPNQFMAIVQITGDDGQILRRSAQPLLGLKQTQKITVRGEAKINELDMLVVTVKQLYVGK